MGIPGWFQRGPPPGWRATPGRILAPLRLIYGVNYLLSTLLGRWLLPRATAIALAVAVNAFGASGSDAALVVALAYIIQVQSAAWYVKLNDRIFGPVPVAAALQPVRG